MSGKFQKCIIVISVFMIYLSCSEHSPVENSDDLIVKESRVSDCGGFQDRSESTSQSNNDEEEKLIWNYDKNSRIFKILNSSVRLNCCGIRKITAFKDGDVIVIYENDQPTKEGRCRCMCNIDFSIELEDFFPGIIELRLYLTVDSTTYRKWSGSMDLNDEKGEINIKK